MTRMFSRFSAILLALLAAGVMEASRVKDLTWLAPDGTEMTDAQWESASVHAIALRVAGDAIDEPGPRGERIVDDTLLLLMNAGGDPVEFSLPPAPRAWQLVLDTRTSSAPDEAGGPVQPGGSGYELVDRSLALLRLIKRR